MIIDHHHHQQLIRSAMVFVCECLQRIMISLSSRDPASRREIVNSATQEIARLGYKVTKQPAKKEMFFLKPLEWHRQVDIIRPRNLRSPGKGGWTNSSTNHSSGSSERYRTLEFLCWSIVSVRIEHVNDLRPPCAVIIGIVVKHDSLRFDFRMNECFVLTSVDNSIHSFLQH